MKEGELIKNIFERKAKRLKVEMKRKVEWEVWCRSCCGVDRPSGPGETAATLPSPQPPGQKYMLLIFLFEYFSLRLFCIKTIE